MRFCSENLVIILGTMQLAKKIPFEDPNVLNMCRALYIASNLIIAGLYLFVQMKINKNKGTLARHLRSRTAMRRSLNLQQTAS